MRGACLPSLDVRADFPHAEKRIKRCANLERVKRRANHRALARQAPCQHRRCLARLFCGYSAYPNDSRYLGPTAAAQVSGMWHALFACSSWHGA